MSDTKPAIADVNPKPYLPLFKPTIIDHGFFAEHDLPCTICLRKPAVLEMWHGLMTPCWDCRLEGWRVVQVTKFPRWLRWLVLRWVDV